MYESPIEMFDMTKIEHHIDEQIEKAVFKAITKVGVNVNREELIKALQYDRDQYEKGYADGKRDGIEWHLYPQEKPTESGEYNVTIRNVNVVILATYDAKHDSWEVPNTLVIAWTDLLKPYEEGEDE